MKGLLMAAALAPACAQQNSIENTFNIISLSVINSIGYLLDVPVNMGNLNTFLAGKKINAPLSNPIITTDSAQMAASGSVTQESLWGSVAVENVVSMIGFDDTGATQLFESDLMQYRESDPAACEATTSTTPSESTGAEHEDARTTNCLTNWHIDSTGIKTVSFVNQDYDPRVRPWYMEAKAAGAPVISSLYPFVQDGGVGLTYAVPLYTTQSDSTSGLIGVLGFDYYLDDIEVVLSDNNVRNVVQYITTSNRELVATSTGESKSTSGTLKLATAADNFIIRESAAYISTTDTASGSYFAEYKSATDDSTYIMKVTDYKEGSSLNWRVVQVTEEDHVPEMSVKSDIVLADLNAALNDLTQNTESVAYYLEFMSGTSDMAPLSSPIVEDSATATLSSVTSQTLWGVMNSFHEVADIMMVYADKKMYHYHADNTRMFYRDSGAASTYDEYNLNADGTVNGASVSSEIYDPTAEPFYTLATESASWTPFFADPSDTPIPEIAFSLPIFISSNLEAVVSTTIYQKDFANVLMEFSETGIVYFILDEMNKLIGTSHNETTWNATAGALISGGDSEDILVKTASQYIIDNSINMANTFVLQNDELNLEDMIISVKKYTDARKLLDWKIVSSQYFDEDLWYVSNDSDGDDDEVATAVAITMGVLLFLVVAGVVALLAVGKLTLSGAASSDTESLSKSDGQTSSSKL